MMEGKNFIANLSIDLKSRGLGPLAAFLIRANWPMATIYANVLMGLEPFIQMTGNEARPYYELLNDRAALSELLLALETDD